MSRAVVPYLIYYAFTAVNIAAWYFKSMSPFDTHVVSILGHLVLALLLFICFHDSLERPYNRRVNGPVQCALAVCSISLVWTCLLGVSSLGDWGRFVAEWLLCIVAIGAYSIIGLGLHQDAFKFLGDFARNTTLQARLLTAEQYLRWRTDELNAATKRLKVICKNQEHLFGEPNVKDCCATCLSQHSKFCSAVRSGTCAVCFDEDVELAALIPCGHIIVCRDCARVGPGGLVSQCPFCRRDVRESIAVYDVSPPPLQKEEVDVPAAPAALVLHEVREAHQDDIPVDSNDDDSEEKASARSTATTVQKKSKSRSLFRRRIKNNNN